MILKMFPPSFINLPMMSNSQHCFSGTLGALWSRCFTALGYEFLGSRFNTWVPGQQGLAVNCTALPLPFFVTSTRLRMSLPILSVILRMHLSILSVVLRMRLSISLVSFIHFFMGLPIPLLLRTYFVGVLSSPFFDLLRLSLMGLPRHVDHEKSNSALGYKDSLF